MQSENQSPVEARTERTGPVGWAIIGLFLIALVGALVIARAFFMPVLLAFLLALTFSPIRRFMGRRGISSGVTAAVITMAIAVLLVVGATGLSAPVREYADNAPQILNDVERKLRGLSAAVEEVAAASDQVEKVTSGGDTNDEMVVVEGPGILSQVATGAPLFLAQVVLTLALMFFLLSSGDMFYEKIVQASSSFRDKRRAVQIAYDIERKISRYFLTITIINAGLGIAIGFVLYLLKMPNPALFAVMAFIFNFIPFLGAVMGTAITAAIGLVHYDQALSALAAAGAYFALTSFEGQFVTPYAVGRSLKLNPVVVFVAVAFWAWAWSVIGMAIAVPVLIVIRAFSTHVPSMKGLGLFLSGRDTVRDVPPRPPPETRPVA